MQPYSTADGVVPGVLACGHDFCESCRGQMLPRLPASQGRKVLPCPTCAMEPDLMVAATPKSQVDDADVSSDNNRVGSGTVCGSATIGGLSGSEYSFLPKATEHRLQRAR
jgi:hypothetical protein